jgi:hypothetical protein
MKHGFLLGLLLTFSIVVTFTGCDSAIGPTAETATLNASRTAILDTAGSGDLETVTIIGPLAVVDGAFAVLYQGSPWYIKGVSRLGIDLNGGETVAITGKAAPVLDRDSEGNSLFFGYYLQAENIIVN